MYQFEISGKFLPHIDCHLKLKLMPGTIHVITGENGIGKSTVLKKMSQGREVILSGQKPLNFFFERSLSTFKKILLQGESFSFCS